MGLSGLIRIALTLMLPLAACEAASAKRVALVIGNQDYQHIPRLQKAIGDVDAMRNALERLGFAVTSVKNADYLTFTRTILRFAAQVERGDEVVVHYSGHGVAIKGRNYLLPVDLEEPEPGQEAQVVEFSRDAGLLVDAIRAKQPRFIFAVFDACRDNPFENASPTRSASGAIGLSVGLARAEAELGAFLLFSAGLGEQALDRLNQGDEAETSVFTRVLLEHIEKPGLTLQALARTTQLQVRALAATANDHQQFPDYSDRTLEDVTLVPGGPPPALAIEEADKLCRLAKLYGTDAALMDYIRAFPTHRCAQELNVILERRIDETAFNAALRTNTLAALEAYKARPNALRAAEAEIQIAAFKPRGDEGSAGPVRLARTLEGHGGIVHAVAFTPDGRFVVSGSGDKTVRVWDAATGSLARTFQGHTDFVSAVAVSPDGVRLASGGWDNVVKMWDLRTGALIATLSGHEHWINALAFSPDGRTLASASRDRTIRFWESATGASRSVLRGHEGYVTAVAFAPDGRTLASASRDETIRLWSVETGEARSVLRGHAGRVLAVAISADGTVATGGGGLRDTSVRLWDLATGRALRTFQAHSYSLRSLAFSPDGRTLASASNDDTAILWDPRTGQVKQRLAAHDGSVAALAFSPDGRTLATGGNDKTVKLWIIPAGGL